MEVEFVAWYEASNHGILLINCAMGCALWRVLKDHSRYIVKISQQYCTIPKTIEVHQS